MLLDDILHPQLTEAKGKYAPIGRNCSNFLAESGGLPLFKYLPASYEDVRKVKVRFRKNKDEEISETFNQAFSQFNIRQRAVFANGDPLIGTHSLVGVEEDYDLFYIFPKNGYKFMYCTEVFNSGMEYKQAFDSLLENLGNDKDEASKLIIDLLQYTYVSTNLVEGIDSGSEIIFYNIPYYYAVKSSSIDYDELLTILS